MSEELSEYERYIQDFNRRWALFKQTRQKLEDERVSKPMDDLCEAWVKRENARRKKAAIRRIQEIIRPADQACDTLNGLGIDAKEDRE